MPTLAAFAYNGGVGCIRLVSEVEGPEGMQPQRAFLFMQKMLPRERALMRLYLVGLINYPELLRQR